MTTESNDSLLTSAARTRRDERTDSTDTLPTIEDLLQQAYEVHQTITKGLHKQVTSLSQLLAQKEQEVKNASCQRCSSVKDTFEKYKASHQQIVAKQETKIELLEQRLLAFEKDQRERSTASRHGSSTSAVYKNFSCMEESKLHAMDGSSILIWESEDESPVSASRNFVPPSPPCFRERNGPLVSPSVRARSSPYLPRAKAKAELQESPSLLAKVNNLPPANAEAVNAEVGGSAETDAAAKTTKTEHLANDASTRTLNARVQDHSRDLELPTVDPGRSSCTPPRVPDHSVTKPAEENSRTATSPSLLQILLQSPVRSGQPSTPRPPGKEWQSAVVGEGVVAVGAVPKPTVDRDYDPSQSLLRPLASVCTPKIEKSPAETSGDDVPTGRVSVDLTFSTQGSDKSSPRPAAAASAGESVPDKLSLGKKRLFPGAERRRGPGQVAGSCKPSPPRKRKKQTKLSDRYFLAVNRHSPFTRNLARRKELSQTKLGRRSVAEAGRESKEDLDETCLPVGTLEISDTPVPDAPPVPDALPALDVVPNGAEAARDSDKERVAHTSGNVDDPSEVAHKFHGTPVRGREARQRLPAHECKDCQDFYERAGHGRRQELLKKCSRHRALHAPPPTPDNFWELDFPDTQECRARGYLNETLNDTPRNGPR